jgi:hypothetical protein
MENSRWVKIPLEEATKHPLYGYKGWLIAMWGCTAGMYGRMGILCALVAFCCYLPLHLKAKDKIRFWGTALFVVLPPLLLFLFHSGTYDSSSVGPVMGSVIEKVRARRVADTTGFWILNCIFWIPYLLLSKRVRVTYENTVLRKNLTSENGKNANFHETSSAPASVNNAASNVGSESATASPVMRNPHLQDTLSAASKSTITPTEATTETSPPRWEEALLAKKYKYTSKLFQHLLNHLESFGKLNEEEVAIWNTLLKEESLLLKEKLQSVRDEKHGTFVIIGQTITSLKDSLLLDVGKEKDVEQEINYAMALYKEAYPNLALAHKSWDELCARSEFEKVKGLAEQGSADAQLQLGIGYATGRGVARNDVEAVKWYRKAAEQGNAEAQFFLGKGYAEGRDKNDTEAVKWYRMAAEQGNAKAQCNLGAMYYEGRGVETDYTEAVKWFHEAAEQGSAEAQCNLGWAYVEGRGVEKRDFSEAVKWHRKAAAQGNENSQAALKTTLHLFQ